MASTPSTAYKVNIIPNGKDGKHDTSPAWVLSFLRWGNRYLNVPEQEQRNAGNPQDFLFTREILVVENDCASVVVHQSKGSHTPTMQAMLYPGDINYLTAIAPGDFVFVNMLEWESEARRVGNKARAYKPINEGPPGKGLKGDGFKGLFKVHSVRQMLSVDPATGIKRIMYQITAYGFTEFDSTIYFNPFLVADEGDRQFLFVSRISKIWEQYVSQLTGTIEVQNLLKLLIESLIGQGLQNELNTVSGIGLKTDIRLTENTHFYVPSKVGQLLGVRDVTAAKDIYNYLFGVQKYVSGSNQTIASGVNPSISTVQGRFYITNNSCPGKSLLKPEYWNQTTLWSILNQYTNSPINELFTCFRLDINNKVMPTVVFRQTPFSSDKYEGLSTKFLNLPRWQIDSNLLLDINLGREEAARINFVQVFGSMPFTGGAAQENFVSNQIGGGNSVADTLDIRRSGLKPYIVTTPFDEILSNKQNTNAPQWAKLLADALIGGQLKLNGTIETFGIVEPIAVGDNVELDGVVYHIDTVVHRCSVAPYGKKIFRTTLELTHGIEKTSAGKGKIFAQMRNTDAQLNQEEDYEINSKKIPGLSDEQRIVGREGQTQGRNTTSNGPFSSIPGLQDPEKKKDTNRKDK
jgi:hypothetical protein